MANSDMNYIRRGKGKPLLLIHGLGGSWRSWNPILEDIAAERDVIAIDLPGFGDTAPLFGEVSITTLADAVTLFLQENNLIGIDAVGSSMGGRLVLELARRGDILGAVIALDPGGFWKDWERTYFYSTIAISIKLIRKLQKAMPDLTGNLFTRSLLFAQFSARPWKLDPKLMLDEMRTFAASPSFNKLLKDLAYGEKQLGLPVNSMKQPLVIGWGRKDRVCLPRQANRALTLFPDAHLHWFEKCGHFPQWDVPKETVKLILGITS